ncbi:cytochrome c oxidase subunit 5b-1, mitochondrial-like [Impatiens glandulifera]|uniref:cytochrome c oxidase subunit 5b-1, mitochondrial-like n=1 Tax=Impatiens glandulifera TaxID=253017 RepID=UPI001FB07DBD|nr:cytochrome c oxidase subunit 5b-1, mitochondrial-like [Impatiens glandulifera]
MWRRIPSKVRALASSSRSTSVLSRYAVANASSPSRLSPPISIISRSFSPDLGTAPLKRKVEDVMPIATGHEREELQAELEGRQVLDIDYPSGPFGTQEAPSIIKSYYDRRIVGCPGGEDEDEHDVVWFWLEKGKTHECPVCTQNFALEVVGPGGPPDGHGDDDHDHHH